jgi:hypothetical protein
MIGLDQRATVYAEGTSRFDQVLKTDLHCRLAHVNARNASNATERAELMALRRLLWDPSYVMPEAVQLLIGGDRWQPVPGTFAAPRGPSGQVAYRAADAVRQSS